MSDSSVPPSSAPGSEAVEAFCEYLRLLELDQAVELDAFCAERPELAGDLRRLFAEYERVTEILERLTPTASFSHRLRERYGGAVDPGISLSADEGELGAGRPGAVSERLATLGSGSGRYEPRGEIARGGMGAILKVWDRELRRMLAMKVVLARRGERAEDSSEAEVGERRLSRFLEEAQITAQLDHPGIVPVHDLGLDSKGRVYFTMQLIDGRDLREVFELARLGREGWTQTRVLSAMLRVCEAMAYAHSKGVVHRDLKPANIMVGRFGETYVMDWGLAKVVGREDRHDLRLAVGEEAAQAGGRRVVTDRSSSSDDDDSPLRTLDGDVVGTPAYMSPEQALGRLSQVGPQSDVYSVGAMLYHLLSGHMPYEPLGERTASTTVLEAVRSGAPWPLAKIAPSCSAELVAVCEKAMAREPERRYPDMISFAEDLRAYLEGRVVRAYETGAIYEFRKWVSRNRGVAAALGALVLLVVLSVGVFIRQQQVKNERLATANAEIESERKAAIGAKQLAEQRARDLDAESQRLEVARKDALEKKELAEQNWQMALENAEATRRQGYRAQILAADFSLRLEDVAVAKASLADTDPDLRAWEWRYLRLASEGATGEVLRSPTGIADLSVDAAGRLLVCIGLDFNARVVDLESREVEHELSTATFGGWGRANPYRLRTALSPRAGLGLAAAQGDAILVFNAAEGRALGQLAHTGAKTALSFSADGRRIVSASEAGSAVVFEPIGADIRPIAHLERQADRPGHDGAVLCAALDPIGERVLTGGADGTANLWLVRDGGQHLATIPGDPSRAVLAAAWAPRRLDGREHVALSYSDGSIAVYDPTRRDLVTVLHGHTKAARALAFTDDARGLYSGGDDMTVRLWSLPSGLQQRVFRGHDREVTALAPLEGGQRVLSSSLDGTVRTWDPAWDPAVTVVRSQGELLALGFDEGDRLLFACPDRGGPRGWRVDTGLPALVLEPPEPVPGQPSPELQQAACYADDGALLATCGMDQRVRVRRTADGEVLAELVGPGRRVSAMALSADGARLALGVSDGSVWTYAWREDPRPRRLEGHRRDVLALAYSPDGALLASAGRDRALRLWDAASGELRDLWTDAHALSVSDLAFSADGAQLTSVSIDGRARVWRQGARQPLLTLESQENALTAVACSPDGQRLVTGSARGELALWDALTGDFMLYLLGHRGTIVDLAFSRDGTRIFSCSVEREAGESELRVWESNPGEPRYAELHHERARSEKAREVVARLYQRLHWPDAVDAALSQAVPAGELAVAEREARLLAHDPGFLSERCLEVLLQPDAPAEDCHRALATAERVGLLSGYDARALSVLGAAQVRERRYEEGLRNLRAADQRAEAGGPVRRARDAVFEALAQLRLAHPAEARAALTRAQEPFARLDELAEDELEPMMALQPLMRAVELELAGGGRSSE